MSTLARTSVSRPDREDPVASQLERDGTARLRFSRPTIDFLEELSIRLNTPVADLLTQAVGLFIVAVDAQARGERVCLVDDDLDILGEIAGFGATAGVGVAPFPETEADQDEP